MINYFKSGKEGGNNISWWGGKTPTGNTLSSQIACLNHLFPIRHDEEAVLAIINNLKIDGADNKFGNVMNIPYDKFLSEYIAFEVVSNNKYLNETHRKRGSNCTSIDALIYAEENNNAKTKWIILIEWKYTESYYKTNKAKGDSGKTRQDRYNKLIDKSEFLVHLSEDEKKWLNDEEMGKPCVYYLEPFYQLMRQTLWAEQVIKHRKGSKKIEQEPIEAENFIHIHVVPSENPVIRGKSLTSIGSGDMAGIWTEKLRNPKRYIKIDPEDLMKPIEASKKYLGLIEYLRTRYWKIASECK